MKKFLILALLSAAACGSKSDKSNDTAAGGGDECTVATTKAVDGMVEARLKRIDARAGSGSGDVTDRKAQVEAQAVKMKTILAKHCNDDKWSKEVLDCFSAGARDALQTCRAKLPQEQQKALSAELTQVMMHGNGGMHGMGGRHEGMGSAMGSGQEGSATTPPSTGAGSGSAATAPAGSGSAK